MAASLAEQLRAVAEDVGGPAELVRLVRQRVRGAGLTKQRLSALLGGQTPSTRTLREIAAATQVSFVIGPETDVGTSRPSYPSDQRPKPRTKGGSSL